MKIKKINLKIKGMTCDSCAHHVTKALVSVDGVSEVKIDSWKSAEAEVILNKKIDRENLITAVKKSGYSAEIQERFIENQLSENSLGKSDYNLIIIGGGSAAFAAALKASELEKTVLMINDGLPIGGTCVNVGCVPSKTLIRTAEAFYYSNHPNFPAIKPGENKIDFKDVINQKRELVENLRQKKYINVISDDPNVTVVKGRGKLHDRNTVEINGELKSANKILIATGSSTFIPDIPGLKETKYYINDTLYELDKLPEHLIIIGGRYIALENAQMFARLGSKVTLLQRSSRILPTEMPDITDSLTEYLREEGINVITDVKISSVSDLKGKVEVMFTSHNMENIVEGSHLFIATGRKGNTKDIGLENLGMEFYGNDFIKTDKYLRANSSNIFAAGDVTGEHLFVYVAAYQGALAVENAFSGKLTEKNYEPLPWVIFTDPQVAGVGLNENTAAQAGIDYDVSIFQVADIPRALAARNTKGFIKLIRNKADDKLIGARILASEGSELLMEAAMAIKYGITIKELKQMFHPYLTLSEGMKLAAITFDKDVGKLSCCAV